MRDQPGAQHPVFIVMVTSGTIIEYAPEVYRSRSLAANEAERWAWSLSTSLQRPVNRPFEDRWEIGDHDVRLVSADATGVDLTREWWVGTHWTSDGSPDPEARLISGKAAAREWVEQEPGQPMNELHETRWAIAASFGPEDDEVSVAHLAKICDRLEPKPLAYVEYDIELTGTFVQTISGTLEGPPGLSRDGVDALIERNWAELSANTDVLLESSWEIERFTERSPAHL
jgi:hypothetical protein